MNIGTADLTKETDAPEPVEESTVNFKETDASEASEKSTLDTS